MSDQYGVYERTDGEGEKVEVTLQADEALKKRYEDTGFKFLRYVMTPGKGVTVGEGDPAQEAQYSILGKPLPEPKEIDTEAVVEEAIKIATRRAAGLPREEDVEAGQTVPPVVAPYPDPIPVDGAATDGADGTGTPAVIPATTAPAP